MKLVILESPYAGNIERNVQYARACMKDCLDRGEAPMVSHLLYTQVLSDFDAMERQQGIDAGLAWRTKAEKSVVYTDLGITKGMIYGITLAEKSGNTIELRSLKIWAWRPWAL
jgi:hypothetical protein